MTVRPRVLIADDHAGVANALNRLLSFADTLLAISRPADE